MTTDYYTSEDLDRLNRIHKERETDLATLAAVINKAVNDKIVSLDRIIRGEINQVYLVRLQNFREKVILRISKRKKSNFPHESWAIEQAGKAGVPVPKVLTFGTFQTEQQSLHYSIQERINGKSFDNLLWSEKIPAKRARLITNEAGEILARIHNVSTIGYGRINTHGRGQYETVKDMVLGECFKRRNAYTRLLKAQGLSESAIDDIFIEFAKAKRYLTLPRLIHRDFVPKHIFVDNNDHIVGIIDWEDVQSGDPSFDFSAWQFWLNDSYAPIDWLFEGYKRHSNLGVNFDERFKIARLYFLNGLINYYVNEAPYLKWAEAGTETIKKILRT
jgi:aminoglycoside phosphotransferase (APT) family kinase protein